MKMLWLDFDTYSKGMKRYSRVAVFSLSGISRKFQNTYPILDSEIKAAHIKIVLVFLSGKCNAVVRALQKEPIDVASLEHAKLRATCIWSMCEFLHVLDVSGRWLDDTQVKRAQWAGRLFLLSYPHLAKSAYDQHYVCWKQRPKFHYFDHLLE